MIQLQFPPYAMVLFTSAFVTIGLGIYGLFKGRDRLMLFFGLGFTIAGLWPLLYGIELIIANIEIASYFAKYRATTFQFFPFFMLCIVYMLTKRKMPPAWLIYPVLAFGIMQVFLFLTTDIFFNIWAKFYYIKTSEGFIIHVALPGLWLKFTVLFYHFGIYLYCIVMLAKALIKNKQPYKTQYGIIITAMLVTITVALLFTYNIVDFGPYNPVPSVMLLFSSMVALSIIKFRIFSVIPYAKESVFDIIENPVLILNEHNVLIDFNKSADKRLRVNSSMIGADADVIFDELNLPLEKLETDKSLTVETKWGTGHNYTFSTVKKAVSKDNMRGFIIVFSDITKQLDVMKTKHAKEILTYKESILGDMHDGIGGVVATAAMLAQTALDEDDEAVKDKKIAQIAQLLENGSFELRSMLNILDKEEIDWRSLVSDMRSFSATVLEAKGISRKFTSSGTPYAQYIHFDVYLSIFRLFKEVITNIIKHSEASNVTIEIEFRPEVFSMVIHDNGIGISTNGHKGYGLKNIRKRAENLNGTIEFTSENGTTVCILLKMPIDGSKGL